MIRPKRTHRMTYKPVHKPYRSKHKEADVGETLGWLGGCWCGKPAGHTWEGEEDGKPHPR